MPDPFSAGSQFVTNAQDFLYLPKAREQTNTQISMDIDIDVDIDIDIEIDR